MRSARALPLALLSWLALAAPALAEPACRPAAPDLLGPFCLPGVPERSTTGRGLVVTGTVRSAAGCAPAAGAVIEWWAANPPGVHPGRPPHLHLRVSAPGHRTLVTQLYPRRGQTALAVDLVLVPD